MSTDSAEVLVSCPRCRQPRPRSERFCTRTIDGVVCDSPLFWQSNEPPKQDTDRERAERRLPGVSGRSESTSTRCPSDVCEARNDRDRDVCWRCGTELYPPVNDGPLDDRPLPPPRVEYVYLEREQPPHPWWWRARWWLLFLGSLVVAALLIFLLWLLAQFVRDLRADDDATVATTLPPVSSPTTLPPTTLPPTTMPPTTQPPTTQPPTTLPPTTLPATSDAPVGAMTFTPEPVETGGVLTMSAVCADETLLVTDGVVTIVGPDGTDIDVLGGLRGAVPGAFETDWVVPTDLEPGVYSTVASCRPSSDDGPTGLVRFVRSTDGAGFTFTVALPAGR